MFLLWHPSLTAINLSYTFPILETSATALCGTTGILLYLKCLKSHLVWAKAVHNKHKALIEMHGYSTARSFSPRCVQFGNLQEIELEATTNHHGQSPRPHFHSTLQQWVNLYFPPGHHKLSPDLQNPHKILLEFLLTTPNGAIQHSTFSAAGSGGRRF